MPVTMDEVQILKCHLSALEWSKKVKPYLDDSRKDFPKLTEMRSLYTEIVKYHTSL